MTWPKVDHNFRTNSNHKLCSSLVFKCIWCQRTPLSSRLETGHQNGYYAKKKVMYNITSVMYIYSLYKIKCLSFFPPVDSQLMVHPALASVLISLPKRFVYANRLTCNCTHRRPHTGPFPFQQMCCNYIGINAMAHHRRIAGDRDSQQLAIKSLGARIGLASPVASHRNAVVCSSQM